MNKLFLFLILCSISANIFAQDKSKVDSIYNSKEVRYKADFGLGFGLDYGGLVGIKLSICPFDHFLIIGAGGYQQAGFGWNLGVAVHLFKKTNKNALRPYGKIMYGTNASSYIDGAPEYTKTFLGPTFGLGMAIRFGRHKNNGINFDLNVPIRDDSFDELIDEIEADPRVEITGRPSPILFSIGYHFEF